MDCRRCRCATALSAWWASRWTVEVAQATCASAAHEPCHPDRFIGLTLASSFLFAMTTLCSSATMMFLSAPNLKLSATTRESYCFGSAQGLQDKDNKTHLDLVIVDTALLQSPQVPGDDVVARRRDDSLLSLVQARVESSVSLLHTRGGKKLTWQV